MPKIVGHFNIKQVHVVPVPNNSSERNGWNVLHNILRIILIPSSFQNGFGNCLGTTLSAISGIFFQKPSMMRKLFN